MKEEDKVALACQVSASSGRNTARIPSTNLGFHQMLLLAGLPSVHQDGPLASSHTTAPGFAIMNSVDDTAGPMRLTLRRVDGQILLMVAEEVGFPYRPINVGSLY